MSVRLLHTKAWSVGGYMVKGKKINRETSRRDTLRVEGGEGERERCRRKASFVLQLISFGAAKGASVSQTSLPNPLKGS